jgi:hypothetical protein
MVLSYTPPLSRSLAISFRVSVATGRTYLCDCAFQVCVTRLTRQVVTVFSQEHGRERDSNPHTGAFPGVLPLDDTAPPTEGGVPVGFFYFFRAVNISVTDGATFSTVRPTT